MPWQSLVADVGLEVDTDGKYVHPLLLALLGRQSGKTRLLVHLMLYLLFVGDQKLILYAAQDRQQAESVFDELVSIVESTPALHVEIAVRREANGQEMLRLNDGSTLRILSTHQSSWRGWSADACHPG